jgi:hypothetical protein
MFGPDLKNACGSEGNVSSIEIVVTTMNMTRSSVLGDVTIFVLPRTLSRKMSIPRDLALVLQSRTKIGPPSTLQPWSSSTKVLVRAFLTPRREPV